MPSMNPSERDVRLTVLGCRGSMPVGGRGFSVFGRDTSAYLLEAGGEQLLLDAGTGLSNLFLASSMSEVPMFPSLSGKTLRLLMTHCHVDHILGLPLFLAQVCRGKRLMIFGPDCDGEGVEQQFAHLFSHPLWPVGLRDYPEVEYEFHGVDAEFSIGPFRVRSAPSSHPGGSCIYRVEVLGKSVLLATDFEHGGPEEESLRRLAEGADLLLYDGQYSEETYINRRGYGHSTPEKGAELFLNSGAGRLRIVHHDPGQTDDQLMAREWTLRKQVAERLRKRLLDKLGDRELADMLTEKQVADLCGFAREGEVILL